MAGRGPVPRSTPWTVLPAEGRTGNPPKWPLSKMVARELSTWRKLWAMPAAVEWQRLGLVDQVARYCRVKVRAEQVDAPVVVMAECRHLETVFGIGSANMAKLRRRLAGDGEPLDYGTGSVPLEAGSELEDRRNARRLERRRQAGA
jgi:hypothetical protein